MTRLRLDASRLAVKVVDLDGLLAVALARTQRSYDETRYAHDASRSVSERILHCTRWSRVAKISAIYPVRPHRFIVRRTTFRRDSLRQRRSGSSALKSHFTSSVAAVRQMDSPHPAASLSVTPS